MTKHPAILPLAAVVLSNPLEVRALKNKGPIKAGSDYYISHILADGKIVLIGLPGQYFEMGLFVEMLATVEHGPNPTDLRHLGHDNDNQ